MGLLNAKRELWRNRRPAREDILERTDDEHAVGRGLNEGGIEQRGR